ncbi:hypothetical protein E4U43_004838 [Claviceps pusilla]|uniref:Inner kinetochore subunit AME1 domain-containing protein n=1 Tax=Claviceps pusilla TaxID=123648 RepID=A0A9P7N3D1_9HYPO|nr:hypothetical protein E4U43_004838 [Claviceps pusilla]
MLVRDVTLLDASPSRLPSGGHRQAPSREGREDRLNQRLRGAQRVNVGDDISFSFDLAGVPAQSSSSPAVTAQPGRQSQSLVADRTPQGPSPSPNASVSDAGPAGNSSRSENQFVRPLSSSVARSSAEPVQSEATGAQANRPDELEALALPSNVPTSARPRIPTTITEEITESPAHKPGSGHRRRIAADNLAEPIPRRATISSSSTPEAASSSSPSARRPRPSDRPTQPPARPTGLSRPPTLPVREERAPLIQTRAPANHINPPQRRSPSLEQVTEEEELEVSDEEAVKVPAREAATKIGQKRPRPSNTTITSAELGTDDDDDDSELNSTSQISSYPRKRQSPSQRQPAKRSRQHSQQSRSSKSRRHSSSSEQNDDRAAEITVQRFVNNFQRDEDDDLQQEIPYANRAGETVVDVFAQLCDEVMSSAVDQLKQRAAQTDDVDTKKQCRIKIRAIDAYREELGSRLLQHAIHLNHWHSLRRRLRHVQKEKLALRDEIIRLKGERAQVALRMDAIRIKHESDSTESMARLNASALMHDIDLAVAQGREAPELSQADERTAELGNLDLALAQVSDQVSSTSSTGGLLQQIRDFNAFLERAANALESIP